MRVFCKHCEHEKDVDECWCVIDTRNKERYFECKVKCISSAEPTNQVSTMLANQIEEGIRELKKKADEIQEALEIDTTVEDWMDRIPRQTWMGWFKSLFGLSGIRYVKVKLN
jgi:hypothetical protein